MAKRSRTISAEMRRVKLPFRPKYRSLASKRRKKRNVGRVRQVDAFVDINENFDEEDGDDDEDANRWLRKANRLEFCWWTQRHSGGWLKGWIKASCRVFLDVRGKEASFFACHAG